MSAFGATDRTRAVAFPAAPVAPPVRDAEVGLLEQLAAIRVAARSVCATGRRVLSCWRLPRSTAHNYDCV